VPLKQSVCIGCVNRVPTEDWQKVHRLLSNIWYDDRDGWFWRTQHRVRCYYDDNDVGERDTEGDPPSRCPYREQHAAPEDAGTEHWFDTKNSVGENIGLVDDGVDDVL
jgi:hypothetical protein